MYQRYVEEAVREARRHGEPVTANDIALQVLDKAHGLVPEEADQDVLMERIEQLAQLVLELRWDDATVCVVCGERTCDCPSAA